jgi:hypothetical protein
MVTIRRHPLTRMTDIDDPASKDGPPARAKPRRSPLRRILEERPESRPRLARAFFELAATTLVAVAAIGALLIWHVIRRGRLIRERLSAPRAVDLPDVPGREGDRAS